MYEKKREARRSEKSEEWAQSEGKEVMSRFGLDDDDDEEEETDESEMKSKVCHFIGKRAKQNGWQKSRPKTKWRRRRWDDQVDVGKPSAANDGLPERINSIDKTRQWIHVVTQNMYDRDSNMLAMSL